MLKSIELSKRGFSVMWETGGGFTNTGSATCICNPDGSPKKPLYIRKRGTLACSDHALFVVQVGDVVVSTSHHRGDHNTQVYRIATVNKEQKNVELELLAEFSSGEWNDDFFAEKYSDVIRTCQNKAESYHCKKVCFYDPEE